MTERRSNGRDRTVHRSRIPAGRLERLARMGWMAGEIALGGVAERARRLAGFDQRQSSVFFTAANAGRLVRRLSAMRGAAMKLGQLLSLEGEDFLPTEIAQILAALRADAHAMPDAQLRRVLGHAYGKGWQRRFHEFRLTPIAAASIGQVHYGVTTDGRELALKIQYPGVARSIDSDVDNLASILRLSRLLPSEFELAPILKETKLQLRQETNYRIEAEHLCRYAALVEDEEDVVLPRVHDDFTTPHVLAMDYVSGVPLDDPALGDSPRYERDRIAVLLYRLLFREMFEFRFMQTDPNLANYLWQPDSGELALLDFGAAREIPGTLAHLYARLFGAGMENDRKTMRDTMEQIGFFPADERPDRIEALVDLFLIGCEPFRHRGSYDFAASDLPARARAVGLDLTFKKGFLRPPPADTMFLHRKLGGTFLLCARLGARADVRSILRPFLERGSEKPVGPASPRHQRAQDARLRAAVL